MNIIENNDSLNPPIDSNTPNIFSTILTYLRDL